MSSLSTSYLKSLDPILGRQFSEITEYTNHFMSRISRLEREDFNLDRFYLSMIKLFGFEVDANFMYNEFLNTMKLATDAFTDEDLDSRMKIFKIKRVSDRTHVFYSIRNNVESSSDNSGIIRTDIELYENFIRDFYVVFYNRGNTDEDIYLTLRTRYIIGKDAFDSDIYKNMSAGEIKGRRSSRTQRRRVRKVRRIIDFDEYTVPTQSEIQHVLKNLTNQGVQIPDLGKIINFFISILSISGVKIEKYFFLTFVNLVQEDPDLNMLSDISDIDIINVINIIVKASYVLGGQSTKVEKYMYQTLFKGFDESKHMVIDEIITEENFKEEYGFLIPLFDNNIVDEFNLFEVLELSEDDEVDIMYDYLTEIYYNLNEKRKREGKKVYNRDYISNIFLPKSSRSRRKEYVGNRGEAVTRGYLDSNINQIPIYYYLNPIYNLLPLKLRNMVSAVSADTDTDIQYISESHCRVCGNFVGRSKTFLQLMKRKKFTQEEAAVVLNIDKRCCINTIIDRTIISHVNPYSTDRFKDRIINIKENMEESIKRSIKSSDERIKVMKYVEGITAQNNKSMIPGETIEIGDETYYVEELIHVGSGFITPKITLVT